VDLTPQGVERLLAFFGVAADDVPEAGQESAPLPAAVDVGATLAVDDHGSDHECHFARG
jgi:hypothetical protein